MNSGFFLFFTQFIFPNISQNITFWMPFDSILGSLQLYPVAMPIFFKNLFKVN